MDLQPLPAQDKVGQTSSRGKGTQKKQDWVLPGTLECGGRGFSNGPKSNSHCQALWNSKEKPVRSSPEPIPSCCAPWEAALGWAGSRTPAQEDPAPLDPREFNPALPGEFPLWNQTCSLGTAPTVPRSPSRDMREHPGQGLSPAGLGWPWGCSEGSAELRHSSGKGTSSHGAPQNQPWHRSSQRSLWKGDSPREQNSKGKSSFFTIPVLNGLCEEQK